MKTIKIFIFLVALFCSQQSNAFFAITNVQSFVCLPGFDENGIAFVGEYLQHQQVLEELGGMPSTVYVVQYRVTDLWCGEVITDFDPLVEAPIWASMFQNTQNEVWIAIRPLGGVFDVPDLNQRQFVAATTTFNAVYLINNTQGSIDSFSSGPFDITSNDMVEGSLTTLENQILPLSEFRTELSACSSCTLASGIERAPFEISLYPNPTNGYFQVKLASLTQSANLAIRSVDGRLISNQVEDSASFSLDISDLEAGIYIIDLLIDDKFLYRTELVKL